MNRTRSLLALGALCIAGGGVGVWLSFERRMCTMVVGGTCGPNTAYFVPGVLAALVGVALVGVAYRRRREERGSQHADA